ncbi:HD domain-containing protein [Crassaminicella indica]|uniref:HD domain-containing protein n=1 Tax=Crassaminicella indica TaxID=2855394 RepID=A0ABX8RDM9_9CLOT|nr:HD domain-containing protein [Crassaminicella indica]QXM07183.1 HD domain-containing protein [Crassaminicella indica]
MERVNKIIKNKKYIYYLNKNAAAEKDRIFCHHDLQHALDVARIAYILSLEEKLSIKKDIIYAAALLHDIGRWKEYLEGIDHAFAGAKLAKELLESSGFDHIEQALIQEAIKNHRRYDSKNHPLDKIIYKGDKLSRPCIKCRAVDQCKRFDVGKTPKLYY